MTKKVLYFIADVAPTTAENNAIARLAADPSLSVGVRCVKFVDGASTGDNNKTAGGQLETCDGVAGSYPTASGSYTNNYDALIGGGTVVDYSAEAAGGPHGLLVVGGGSATFAHTLTKQLAAVAEAPDGTLSDVTTTAVWTSGTPGVATVGASTGLVTGVTAGTVVITATLTVNGKASVKTLTLTLT